MASSRDSMRLAFSEPFLSQRRKVISGFSLGVGASLVIFILLLLNNSLSVPKPQLFPQGFDSVAGANSSLSSGSFSFSARNFSSVSNATATSESQRSVSSLQRIEEEASVVGKTREVNASGVRPNEDMEPASLGMGLEKTRLGNFTENCNNDSLHADEQRDQQKTHEANVTLVAEKGNFYDSNGKGIVSGKTTAQNSSSMVKEANLLDEERRITANSGLSGEANNETLKGIEGRPPKNSSFSANIGAENNNVSNFSYNGDEGNSTGNNNGTIIHHHPRVEQTQIGFRENCDIFDGKWVRDDSKPYYPLGSCPHIDRDFNCHLNGRPDAEYVKWKWQPNGCDIPSLNATDFLERLRGQRLVFVGDSLNRNMWESLVCVLRQSIRHKKRVYEISGRTEFKKKGFYAFRFEDYNCSVDFVASPFLVRESTFKGNNGSFETLRLDLMDHTTSMYYDADIIVFNTGHWWTHEKTSRGEDYYQVGNYVYPKLKALDAYTRALTTWSRWIDRNIDANRTKLFFRGYSLTHFRGGQWNSGGQCHKETEPIFNETNLEKYPSKMRALEYVISNMKTPLVYLNISKLTDYRKDGHPSIYRMHYKTAAERISAELYQDCSHWCLPGVPDTWNELLYISLLKYGKGTWKR